MFRATYHTLCLVLLSEYVARVDTQEIRSSSAELDRSKYLINVTVYPPNTVQVFVKGVTNVTITYGIAEQLLAGSTVRAGSPEWNVSPEVGRHSIATLKVESRTNSDLMDGISSGSLCFVVEGKQIGKTNLKVTIDIPTWNGTVPVELISEYEIRVLRARSPLGTGLRLGIMGCMSLNFLSFGCKLDWSTLLGYLRRPVGIVIGLVCQFGFMPALSYVLCLVLDLPSSLAFALMAVGCAPGGGPSNVFSLLLNGDTNMSVVMTFFSTLLALAMTPLWLCTLGYHILGQDYTDTKVVIPWLIMALGVALFTVPTVIGVIIRRFRSRAADVITRVVRPIAFLLLIAFIVVVVYMNYWVFYNASSWQLFIASAAVPYSGFVLSFLLAYALTRKNITTSVTIMFETGIQNMSFSILLLLASLPAPDGDIALIVPVLVILFTYVPLLVAAVFFVLFNRFRNSQSEKSFDVMTSSNTDSVATLESECKQGII